MAPPVTNGLIAHYDADALTLNDGDAVTTWTDESGNGNDATGGSPTYKTGQLNGLPVVDFDGTDDVLDVEWPSDESLPNTFIGVVSQPTADSATFHNPQGETNTSTYYNFMARDSGANNDAWRIFAGTTLSSSDTTVGPLIATAVYDGTNSLLRIDRAEVAAGDAGSLISSGLSLMAWADGTRFNDGIVAEVLVYDRRLTSTEIDDVENYLNDKWFVASAKTITFDPHTVLLKHRPLFEGVFSPHTVVLNHFKAVPLQPHFINLSHFGNTAKSDDSEQGQATALRKLLGYGWGVPDPAGSANEKIETPRESWPIHRFHEAERLLRQEGVEEPTVQALGDALHRLGEDIHLDVKENLQRYEWHANAHTHSALGGAGTTPIGPADSVFLCGGSLRRYRADNGNLVWSVGSNLDRMALDHVNEVIFATKQGSSSSDVDKVEAYDFGGSLVWSSDPFLNVTDSKNDHLTICLSRDRESLYMIYHKDNNEIGVIRLRTADGSVETVGSSTGFSTDGLPNNVVIDTINDFLYVTDGYGQDDGRVIKLSLGDGKFKWKTALNHSGSSSSSICATETLIWAMAGNELYALDPSDGSIVDSTLFSVNDYTGVKITKIWKDFQNSNSVYVLTASRFDPISWLHRAYLVGDTIQADEELYTFEESNADILARDAEGSFYITGGSQATTQLQIYKLNPDLNLAWQRDGNATEILTAQGRSVHWG